MTLVTELGDAKARKYFLTAENYCNVDLPKYINFQPIIDAVDNKLVNNNLTSYFSSTLKPHDDEKVNYRLLGNKDGNYGWRPYELIHPVLYIDLVHLLTEPNNWSELVARFRYFKVNNCVKCCSIPVVCRMKKAQSSSQILAWWEGVEQASIKLALSNSSIFDADVSNCYGSIYTHSISWALHGKPTARGDRSDKNLLGSKIDERIQMMRYRQTNGIPQGNAVSDLVAELVLGYADEIITHKVKDEKIKKSDFNIIRYRDDYKIFTSKPDVGKNVLKIISETLSELGMHLNTSKTKETADAVLGSVKEDKIDELFVTPRDDNYSKWLLQIYATIQKHPNSGKVVRQLNLFHKQLCERHKQKEKLQSYEDAEVMLSIIVNIAVRNPKYYNWSVAIISILLDYLPRSKRKLFASKIVNRFKAVPNTGLLDIWLQRVTFPSDSQRRYNEAFCKLVTLKKYPGNDQIWSSDWIAELELKKIIRKTSIIDREELVRLEPVIGRDEIDRFRSQPT